VPDRVPGPAADPGEGPRLNWGLLTTFDPDRGGRPPQDLARIWQLARQSLGLTAAPIERFELAGTLNEHPGHVRSDKAKADFPAVFALAAAARTAPEPLRAHSRTVAASALLAWARVYRPTGNPVDEWFFVPLLQAIDLIACDLPADQRSALSAWALRFAAAGDRFYLAKPAKNASRANNWMSRRLIVRALACTAAGDEAGRAAMPGLLREFAARAFPAGPDGRPDGRTFDFVQRDALLYHIAGLHPLVEMTLCTPDLISRDLRASVLSGLAFLRPYFLGERRHVEFARTTVSFDRERRDAGNPQFRDAPWDPERGRVLLRLARAAFPEIRPWTGQIVDARCDPRTKLLASIHGEPLRRAEWP
jgi:hypothetical protein